MRINSFILFALLLNLHWLCLSFNFSLLNLSFNFSLLNLSFDFGLLNLSFDSSLFLCLLASLCTAANLAFQSPKSLGLFFSQKVVNGQTGTVKSLNRDLPDSTWCQILSQNMWNHSVHSSHYVLNQLSFIHWNSADLQWVHRPIAHHEISVIAQIVEIFFVGCEFALELLWHILAVDWEWIPLIN